jgi:hypothetical protein
MLDLRDNSISDIGLQLLFDAIRKNSTVLVVNRKQNGSMIEGQRELSGRDNDSHTQACLQPPLRVDVRFNNPGKVQASAQFDLLEAPSNSKVLSGGSSLVGDYHLPRPPSNSSKLSLVHKKRSAGSAPSALDLVGSTKSQDANLSAAVNPPSKQELMKFSFSANNKPPSGPPKTVSAATGIRGVQYQRNLSAVDLLAADGPGAYGNESVLSGYNTSDYEGGDDSDVENNLWRRGSKISSKTKKKIPPALTRTPDTAIKSDRSVADILGDATSQQGLGNLNFSKLAGMVSHFEPITAFNLDDSIRRLQEVILTAKIGSDKRPKHFDVADKARLDIPVDNSKPQSKLTRKALVTRPSRPSTAGASSATLHKGNRPWDNSALTDMTVKERTMKLTRAIYYNTPAEGFSKVIARPASAPVRKAASADRYGDGTVAPKINPGAGAATIALLTEAANNILPSRITDTLGTLTYAGNFDTTDEIKGPMKKLTVPLALYGPAMRESKRRVVNIKQKTKAWTKQKLDRDRSSDVRDRELAEDIQHGHTLHSGVSYGSDATRQRAEIRKTEPRLSKHHLGDDFADIRLLSKLHPATLF